MLMANLHPADTFTYKPPLVVTKVPPLRSTKGATFFWVKLQRTLANRGISTVLSLMSNGITMFPVS